MKKKKLLIFPFLAGLLLGCFGMLFLLENFSIKKDTLSQQSEILALTPSPTLTPTPTPEPTKTPTPTLKSAPTPTLSPIPTPTPTSVPQPRVSSEQINSFIERFANQYGVDPSVLRYIAVCESGFDPLATNFVYAGLYQFTPTTWTKYRELLGEDANLDLRFNAEEAVQTAAFVLSLGQIFIWPSCIP